MALTDPLGDMLTRIRNGQRAKKDSVLSPASKLRTRVLEVLQREGYIVGLTSPEFLNALKQGIHGRVAITYFEWAGENDQKIVMPWRIGMG